MVKRVGIFFLEHMQVSLENGQSVLKSITGNLSMEQQSAILMQWLSLVRISTNSLKNCQMMLLQSILLSADTLEKLLLQVYPLKFNKFKL